MNKRLIALNIAILALLIAPIIIQQVNATTANAYPYHPTCKAFGKVKKDWYVGRKWQEYRDDQGLSGFLPFNRTNENITISFANIVFSKEFENKSISLADESKDTELSATRDVLTSDDLEYIYIEITNASALSANTFYTARYSLSVEERSISTDDYILVTGKVEKTGEHLASWGLEVAFKIVDTGASTRYIVVFIYGSAGTDGAYVESDYAGFGVSSVDYKVFGHDGAYVTVQVNIGQLLEWAGVSWKPSKLVGIVYSCIMQTGSSLDSTSTVKAYIRHAFIAGAKIYVDDPSYTNGLIVNGTTASFTPAAGDIIQIYGANASKVIDVTIPFVYEDTRDFDQICTAIAECYGFQYEWKFILPKSPTSGDKLEYSNTNITLKCWFDGAYIDKLYVNGVDKSTQVSGEKVDTSEGLQDKDRAWTYLVASSLTAGNQYDVELKVKNLPKDVWYSLTSEPVSILTWQWWYDKLLLILAFLSNLLGGIGSSWIKHQREKLRIPKR